MRLEQNSRPGVGPSTTTERLREFPEAGIPAARFDELDDIEMAEYLEMFASLGELQSNPTGFGPTDDDPFNYVS